MALEFAVKINSHARARAEAWLVEICHDVDRITPHSLHENA
jgi:hypothetical protein